MRRALVGVLALAAMGCGGGGDGEAETSADVTAPAAEAPANSFELATICETKDGFTDLPAYTEGPGVHPVFLFNEVEGGSFVYGSYVLPEGWGPDPVTAAAADLAPVELVGCVGVADERPTGVDCEFDSDGDTVTLELVDATYEIQLLEAATGTAVDTLTVEATEGGECPFMTFFEEGDTQYVSLLDDDQVIEALRPVVEP